MMNKNLPTANASERLRSDIERANLSLLWSEHLIYRDLIARLGLQQSDIKGRKAMVRFSKAYEPIRMSLADEVQRIADCLRVNHSDQLPAAAPAFEDSVFIFTKDQRSKANTLIDFWFAQGVNAWDSGWLKDGLYIAGFWHDSQHAA